MHATTFTLAFLVTATTATLSSTPKPTGVCKRPPYQQLLPLSQYAPATKYCSSKYPVQTVTTTIYGTSTSTSVNRIASTTTPPITTTTAVDSNGYEAAWNFNLRNGSGFVSTLCSCIQTTPTRTITATSPATTIPSSCNRDGEYSLGGGACQCEYLISCRTLVTGPGIREAYLPNVAECRRLCDSIDKCEVYSFTYTTGRCGLYTPGQAQIFVQNGSEAGFARQGCKDRCTSDS